MKPDNARRGLRLVDGSVRGTTYSAISNTAMITISGPVGVWFGVGFDATAMKDEPYAIIVDGHGKVTERKLANHGPGELLTASVHVASSSVHDHVRTVVLNRR